MDPELHLQEDLTTSIHTHVLVQSLAILRLDYCNSVLANPYVPSELSYNTSLLRSIRWIPVAVHITSETLILAYKAKHTPSYFKASHLVLQHTTSDPIALLD